MNVHLNNHYYLISIRYAGASRDEPNVLTRTYLEKSSKISEIEKKSSTGSKCSCN